ncbi:Utp11 protein [Capsaspora owczarzaki ATCC 30864]|uniref:Utp11 protein n=1 Tax=Capsaspora owczarzaki (strain ATCC 30864) TaxID=595528 RepID=A0A0D2X150_CAPO3|nr:Utp11 protein [Capsaspora owczarzaki ATCC 30864]KJE90194.1 Utp11 protein [Capsaspora owczarzaki ATCC 30864]|eukprot:XP_004364405.1 Utp11 protein [Capsaspora owczarzaki ATCC 30864]
MAGEGAFKKANKGLRRTHKERSQPADRARFGLLEKKKDYKLRAADFHSKERRLRALQQKANTRNPDEFYFGMIKSSTDRGVHKARRNDNMHSSEYQQGGKRGGMSAARIERKAKTDAHHLNQSELRVLKTQDRSYVNSKKMMERSKIEQLRASLHMIDTSALPVAASTSRQEQRQIEKVARASARAAAAAAAPVGVALPDNGDGDDDIDEEAEDAPETLDDDQDYDDSDADMDDAPPPVHRPKGKTQHIVFVDNENEANQFDAAEHFETLPSLLGRKFNRPRVKDLVEKPLMVAQPDRRSMQKLERKRAEQYQELAARIAREKQLGKISQQMELEKNLMGKGVKRKIRSADSSKPAVYKWKQERKR